VVDELAKEAGLNDLWAGITSLFGSKKQKKRVQSHQDQPDWDRFVRFSASKDFVKALKKSKKSDDQTIMHAESMHSLRHGNEVGKIQSTSDGGKRYEIRELGKGKLGCTCGDWRYKGSVTPGYECKHIKTYKAGKMKTASFRAKTTAFFDELGKIQDSKRKSADKDYNRYNGRPFSNLLTQHDEPEDYFPPTVTDDPTVIIGNEG
jgi:hypothetical protein